MFYIIFCGFNFILIKIEKSENFLSKLLDVFLIILKKSIKYHLLQKSFSLIG
jgi:hypothetical protein